jgi:hypothetical protein
MEGITRSILSLAILAVSLNGCSYLFGAGVSGSFLGTNRPILGYVRSGNEAEGGVISFGSVAKQECRGHYKVADNGISFLGASIRQRKFLGEIYCLDGRTGNFQFISSDKGRNGIVTGSVGGEAFEIKVQTNSKEGCGDDKCFWGINWTHENEIQDLKRYQEVEDNFQRAKLPKG